MLSFSSSLMHSPATKLGRKVFGGLWTLWESAVVAMGPSRVAGYCVAQGAKHRSQPTLTPQVGCQRFFSSFSEGEVTFFPQ